MSVTFRALTATIAAIDTDAVERMRITDTGVEVAGALTVGGAASFTQAATVQGAFTAEAGMTVSGTAVFNSQVRTVPGADLPTSGSILLSFGGPSLLSTGTLTGNITFSTSALGRLPGASLTIRVRNGGTQRTLTFPSGWVFVGAKPANIAANKFGILTVTSFGTSDSDMVAAWAVEP